MNIVIFGPPAAGKGTQCKLLASSFNLLSVSTGDMLRAEAAKDSEIGRQFEAASRKGQLISDDIVIDMIRQIINDEQKKAGILYDGFPRSLKQAKALDAMLSGLGQKIDMVIELVVEDGELEKRMSGRAISEGRSDDTPEIFQSRLQAYRNYAAEILPYYKAQGLHVAIDGSRKPDVVAADISKAIKALANNHSQNGPGMLPSGPA